MKFGEIWISKKLCQIFVLVDEEADDEVREAECRFAGRYTDVDAYLEALEPWFRVMHSKDKKDADEFLKMWNALPEVAGG